MAWGAVLFATAVVVSVKTTTASGATVSEGDEVLTVNDSAKVAAELRVYMRYHYASHRGGSHLKPSKLAPTC